MALVRPTSERRAFGGVLKPTCFLHLHFALLRGYPQGPFSPSGVPVLQTLKCTSLEGGKSGCPIKPRVRMGGGRGVPRPLAGQPRPNAAVLQRHPAAPQVLVVSALRGAGWGHSIALFLADLSVTSKPFQVCQNKNMPEAQCSKRLRWSLVRKIGIIDQLNCFAPTT